MPWQPAPVVYPDAVLWGCGYLSEACETLEEPFSGALVSDSVPSDREDFMVIVRRVGGTADGIFDRPRLAFDVWGPSPKEATDFAGLVIALLSASPNGNPVKAATHIGGPNNVPDPSGQPRRLVTFDITTKGEALA